MYVSYYDSFVLRMRVMTSTVGGNLTNRPPALRHIHVKTRFALLTKFLLKTCSRIVCMYVCTHVYLQI